MPDDDDITVHGSLCDMQLPFSTPLEKRAAVDPVLDPFNVAKHYPGKHDQANHGRGGTNRRIAERTVEEGGSTTKTSKGSGHGRVTTGKSLSMHPERSRVYGNLRNVQAIAAASERFRRDNRDLLSKPEHAIGTWMDRSTNELWFDVVTVVKTSAEADSLARRFNQKAYFDIDTGQEVDTGGTGLSKQRDGSGHEPRRARGFGTWVREHLSFGFVKAVEDDGVGTRDDGPGDRRGDVRGDDGPGARAGVVEEPVIRLSPRAASIYEIAKGFKASQRRAPAGTSIGGQWVDDDSGFGDDLLSPGAEHGPTYTPTGRPSVPNNDRATFVESMPPEFLAKQLAKLETVGITPADMERNIEALFLRARDEFPEVYAMGIDWYEEANGRAGEIAAEFGLDKNVVIGMIAATSPSSEWSQNVALVREMALQYKLNQRVRLSPGEMKVLKGRGDKYADAFVATVGKDGVGPKFNNIPPEQAAWAFSVTAQRKGLLAEGLTPKGNPILVSFATGSQSITKAIKIVRGENISVSLGGQHKIRSFFNNIKDPRNLQGRDDITNDTHAASVAQAFRMPMTAARANATFWGGSSKSSNQNGLYPIYADAYRAVAKKYNLHPNQLQAIAWVTWQHVRDEYPGVIVPKKEKGKPQGPDIFSPAIPRNSGYTTERASTRARYGIQIGARDGVLPRYASQISDWERYRDGTIDYQTYLQKIGSDDAY